jgi:hypothetical protein
MKNVIYFVENREISPKIMIITLTPGAKLVVRNRPPGSEIKIVLGLQPFSSPYAHGRVTR